MTDMKLAAEAELAELVAEKEYERGVMAIAGLLKAEIGPACTDEVMGTLVVRMMGMRRRGVLTGLPYLQGIARRMVGADVLARLRFPSDVLAEFAAVTERAVAAVGKRREAADRRAVSYNPEGRAAVLSLLTGVTSHGGRGHSANGRPGGGKRRAVYRGDESQTEEQGQGQEQGGPAEEAGQPVGDAGGAGGLRLRDAGEGAGNAVQHPQGEVHVGTGGASGQIDEARPEEEGEGAGGVQPEPRPGAGPPAVQPVPGGGAGDDDRPAQREAEGGVGRAAKPAARRPRQRSQ